MAWPEFNTWVGRTCSSVERDGHSWSFTFEEAGRITATCPWRIAKGNRFVLARDDDGQRFGLPAPVDAAQQALTMLNSKISRVQLEDDTADLLIEFGGEATLQFWNDSSGYEGWQASIVSTKGTTVVIGMGGGGTSGYDVPSEAHD